MGPRMTMACLGIRALGGVSVQSFSDFWSVPLYCCWYLGWLAFGSEVQCIAGAW